MTMPSDFNNSSFVPPQSSTPVPQSRPVQQSLIKAQKLVEKLEQFYKFITSAHGYDSDVILSTVRSRIVNTNEIIENIDDPNTKELLSQQVHKLQKFAETHFNSSLIEKPLSEPTALSQTISFSIDQIKSNLESISTKNNLILNKEIGQIFQQNSPIENARLFTSVGEKYLEGRIGIPVNVREAINCFKQGASLGDPVALYHLGNCYSKGLGVESNAEKAKDYWDKAYRGLKSDSHKKIANGKDHYYRALGHLEGKGSKSKKANEKAFKYLLKAAEKGYGQAYVALARHFKIDKFNNIFKVADIEDMYRKGVEAPDAKAYYYLSSAHLYPSMFGSSKPPNERQLLANVWKGIESGDLNCLLLLGDYFKRQKNSIPLIKAITEELKKYTSSDSVDLQSQISKLEKSIDAPSRPPPLPPSVASKTKELDTSSGLPTRSSSPISSNQDDSPGEINI